MKVDLEGRLSLITGASQGIGQAIAHTFAENGAKAAVADINSGEQTVSEIRRQGREEMPSSTVSMLGTWGP